MLLFETIDGLLMIQVVSDFLEGIFIDMKVDRAFEIGLIVVELF